MKFVPGLALAAVSLPLGNDAVAHHAPYGQFAIDDTIDFTGTVVAIEWRNPHAAVLVRAEVDGTEAVYRIELAGLRQLARKGWHGDELGIGVTVQVVNAAMELRPGSTRICCARIYDRSGREFYTDPRPGAAEAPRANAAGARPPAP